MVVCPECGHENAADARFCSQCGHALSSQSTEQPAGWVQDPDTDPAAASPTSDTSMLTSVIDSGINFGGGHEPGAVERTGEIEGLEGLSDEDESAVRALPPGSALLIVQRGPDAGSRFLLDSDSATAGRHPDRDIFLDDVTVSRKHADFRRTPEGFYVTDVGSLNGTYVNKDRIDEVLLHTGDEVQIGKYRFRFVLGGQGPA